MTGQGTIPQADSVDARAKQIFADGYHYSSAMKRREQISYMEKFLGEQISKANLEGNWDLAESLRTYLQGLSGGSGYSRIYPSHSEVLF